MTLKDAINGGMEIKDIANPGGSVEKLPREAKEVDARHLAFGASTTTLCGLDRAAISTAHPSKARKTDCLACRGAYRSIRMFEDAAKTEPERPEKFKKGDHVEFVDGSVWLVDDVRLSGADVRCLLGGGDYARGRKLTIGAESSVRVFLPGEFDALLEESKKAADEAKLLTKVVDGTKATATAVPRAPKWSPTVEEIAEVRRLRALGLSFMAIEATMEWPDSHGNRPFRICKGAYDYLLKDK